MQKYLAQVDNGHTFKTVNSTSRLGPVVTRNAAIKDDDYLRIEEHIKSVLGTRIVFDMFKNEGPYFETFNYTDVLGGVRLNTCSTEINCRIMQEVLGKKGKVKPLPSLNVDKYCLKGGNLELSHLDKIIFLPGDNLFEKLNFDKIDELVGRGFIIKPHPITNPETIIKLVRVYGNDNVLDQMLSGHTLLPNCKEIAGTWSSELNIVARLNDIVVHDICKYNDRLIGNYFDLSFFLTSTSKDKTILKKLLMDEASGWIPRSASDDEVLERINAYVELAYKHREPFKMLTGQKLVGMKRVFNHHQEDPKKQR